MHVSDSVMGISQITCINMHTNMYYLSLSLYVQYM